MTETTRTVFAVKTCYGRGWRIPQEPSCEKFDTQADAQRYADLRNQGWDHARAWNEVERQRQAR